ncbi:MAG: sulfite exporter TauE/SafE family protein [Methylotenera sp.]|nr:sulfite exporter TauE/SafE family protein [Methylotenera sp.]MDO9232380.1 sulfite exporter TauE/SafE family protein [Methylotenera sp.]MDO9389380.1 sulfite exporter TauE/SafE family protein [Methylotenera sp.]MDP1597204.1 sulfite exporter TauE/SafE family protein [Methylotenera sp.]MDP1754532.1 sulfite exporter TauE/SafE family protein [Methylotenera sp.]
MEFGYIFAGFAVGLLVGITGVGGGSLMTPLLVFLFGFKAAVAVGTDLLYAAITKTGGVFVHHNTHKSVDWRVVGWMSAGSLPSAIATIFVIKHLIKIEKDVTGIITLTLGIALILTSVALLIRSYVTRKQIREVEHNLISSGRFKQMQIPLTVFVGVVLGALVTISSVGAGVLGTLALLFLYPKMSTLKVVGTDLAHAIPLTAVAGFGHWTLGHVNFELLGTLLIGSLPGIWIGSHLSVKIPEKVLRLILATLLLIIGLKFVLA